jgi:hypothetical protein
MSKIKKPAWGSAPKMVAIDRTTWNSIKAELIVMWQIVTDYQNQYQKLP